MYDFEFDKNLDIIFDDEIEEYKVNETGETAIITGALTNNRNYGQQGYWIDIAMSNFWTFNQARKTFVVERELEESAMDLANRLVDDDIFVKIKTNILTIDDKFVANFNCLTNSNKVVLTKQIEV